MVPVLASDRGPRAAHTGGRWESWFDLGGPHLARGPFSRWPRVSDGVLAAVAFLGSILAVAASGIADDEQFRLEAVGDLPGVASALLAIASCALLQRRTRPIAVAAIALSITLVWSVAQLGDGHDVVVAVATYGVGRYVDDGRHSVTIAGVALVVSVVGTVIDAHQRIDIVPAVLLTLVPWYVGRRVRNRGAYLALLHDRAVRIEAEQAAHERQALADERARIARELHDVVAHRVSMMTVQAGAAKTIARGDVDTAVEAMSDVELAGRHALGELRHLLGVLRPDDEQSIGRSDELGPQPGLADVTALVDEVAETGVEASLDLAVDLDLLGDVDGGRGHVASAVGLSAYRIVQESLTNVVKHAGVGAVVEIAIRRDGRDLVIEVVNTLDGRTPVLPESGHGIVGMRERAQLLGGDLTACRRGADRFGVFARLPLGSERP